MIKILEQLKKDSKWNLLFFLIPFVLFFAYKIYQHSFVKEGNYAIGYVYKIYWPVISHKKINYSYIVNGEEYNGSDIYNSSKNPQENERYLIKFSVKNPEESDIFQGVSVPDSIKESPPEGWKELPSWAIK